MADDGYDFFAPQPKPTPRAKNTMFDIVPDAFTQKTLELTGDHRRIKGSATNTPGTPDSEGRVPVNEVIRQDTVQDVEAQTWEGVCTRELHDNEMCINTLQLACISALSAANIII